MQIIIKYWNTCSPYLNYSVLFISRYICFQSNLTKVVMYQEWNSKLKTNKILMEKKVQLRKKSFRHYLSQIVNIHNNFIPIKRLMFYAFSYKRKKSLSLVDRLIS